jgi:glycosyltransferase involved in cell wall biosynthesis
MSAPLESPTISIVTPCYNSMPFLPRLHASMQRQTYRNFEWITVDDKSKDATIEMLLALTTPGSLGMKVYALPQNSGGGVATGVGVERACGEVLMIVDHDDELEDFALQAVADEWRVLHERTDLVGLFFRRLNPATGTRIGGELEEGTEFVMSWLANSRLSITDGVFAMRREVAREFFNSRTLEAICLFGVPLAQMAARGKFRAASPTPILKYHRDNPDSQTNAVKISRKTVYTYAKQIDLADQFYFRNPLRWVRQVGAMINFSMRVHGNPIYHHRYIESRWIRALSWCLLPVGFARYATSRSHVVLDAPDFDFASIASLPDLRSPLSQGELPHPPGASRWR